ncbi:hypothetical protein A0256_02245 [Mucilaginibacter sp. PAMC 26640]|nr:hypothetical protein A0256_02245 [Mucilaginibacter sp. PAMC 26640]
MKTKIIIILAAIAMLAACKGKMRTDYEAINNSNAQSGSADSTSVDADSLLSKAPKLVKSADISFKVKNVQQTGDSISWLATKYNGMIMHHQMTSNIQNSQDIRISDDSLMRVAAFKTVADMTIKVPSTKLEEFMTRVSRLGIYVTSRQMDIEDLSLDYLSDKLKLQSRAELVAQQKKGKITIKDPQKVLWLKDDLVDGQINNRRIDAAVKYSTISLDFYQSNTIVKEMIANDDPSAYQLPFFKRLLMAVTNGWMIFTELVLGIANLWVFVLIGIGLWMAYKVYKKRFVEFKA